MKPIQIGIRNDLALAAFERAPAVIERHIDGALARGAGEIAAEARRRAPKSLSQLVGSITSGKVDRLTYEARAGSLHAAYVEHGTGPAAGQPKYYPNPDNLLMYLMTTPAARGFKNWSKSDLADRNLKNYQNSGGGLGRLEQEMILVRRAQAFAWWIYQHGTKAQPYMAPAVEVKRGACEVYVRQAVDRGINEVFGAGTVRYY